MIWKQFTHLEHFPPKLKSRFNSFLTTEFDDSISVEMQLRSIIKWCQGNFKTVDTLIDFINDISNWLKQFENNFDTKLEDSVSSVLSEWQASGKLDVVISEALQWQLDDYIATNEQDKLSITAQLQQTEQRLNAQLAHIAINVKNFGAVGNGVKDDTQAIVDAINYGVSSGCKTVKIPKGTYMIRAYDDGSRTNLINIPSGFTLEMDNETILKCIPNDKTGYEMIMISNADNVTIRGGQLIGERTGHIGTTGEWGFGIRVVGSTNVLIENIKVSNCWGDGISLGYTSYISTRENKDILVNNVICDNNRRQGLTIGNGQNIIVTNSKFINTNGTSPQAGIDVEPNPGDTYVKNVVIENCYFENNIGPDIVSSFSEGVVISKNTIKNSVGGIALLDTNSNSKIVNNSIDNITSGYALYVFSENTIVQGNIISNVVRGATLQGNNISFIDNFISDTTNDGIEINGKSEKCLISKNKLFNIGKYGINVTTTAIKACLIESNQFRNITSISIFGAFIQSIISSNMFNENKSFCISLSKGHDNYINLNTFQNSDMTNSIAFISFSKDAYNNQIINNKFDGIHISVWGATKSYVLGQYVFADNNIYQCTASGTSGTVLPTHTTGVAVDGTVIWQFIKVGTVVTQRAILHATADFALIPNTIINNFAMYVPSTSSDIVFQNNGFDNMTPNYTLA